MRRTKALRLSSSSDEAVADGAVLRLGDDGESFVTLDGTAVDLSRDASSRIPGFAEASSDYVPAESFRASSRTARPEMRQAAVSRSAGALPEAPAGPTLEETLLSLRRSQLAAGQVSGVSADAPSPKMLILEDDIDAVPLHVTEPAAQSVPVDIAPEIAVQPALREPLVRTGMTATLAYLATKGIRPALVLPGTRPPRIPRVRIEHRDDAGNVLGPREAYKAMSRRFHGTGRREAIGERRVLREQLVSAKPVADVPNPVSPKSKEPAPLRNPRVFGMI